MPKIVSIVTARKLLLVIAVAILPGCTFLRSNEPTETHPGSNELLVEAPLMTPAGNEIAVTIDIVGPRKVLVTVTNESTQDVFVPYLRGSDNEEAIYAVLNLEKQDKQTGAFVPLGSGHFGPGYNALGPAQSYTRLISLSDSGVYRVNIPYLIDRRVRDRIMERSPSDLQKDQRETEMKEIEGVFDVASGEITSQPFTL